MKLIRSYGDRSVKLPAFTGWVEQDQPSDGSGRSTELFVLDGKEVGYVEQVNADRLVWLANVTSAVGGDRVRYFKHKGVAKTYVDGNANRRVLQKSKSPREVK